ncbi:hypothetical protein Tco_0358689, partial [Tanacetum coccineum]
RQMRMVGANGGNQFRQYAGQNVGYQNGYNAENQISPFYMYSGLSVIPRMIVKILGSLVQKVILASSLVILLALKYGD